VDTDLFGPDPAARALLRARYGLGDRPTVVCVSRLVPRKGQDMLIRALPLVRRHVPDAALLLAGGGPDRDRLGRLATATGMADHVVFAGSVSWAELPGHYAAGDVFAMPSRTRGGGLDVEAFGLVYLEASATGLPVVAGRSGGAPETVRDGVTGHVVDGRQVTELADVLAGLLADPERATKLGRAGREWALDTWGWPALADRLRRLLDA
jgi:phosphatidylinositol alpha-1,6-mannosyltransferase